MTTQQVGFDGGQWLNPPPVLSRGPEGLKIETAPNTDFWRETHYGFTRASGHALLFGMPPQFAADLTFTGRFEGKYEQAGLLLWEDERNWIKAGVEFADGRPNLAVVVTRERSDWSMAPFPATVEKQQAVTLRLTATASAVLIHADVGAGWQILRVADFRCTTPQLGPMACSPQTGGLAVAFRDFRVGPVPQDPLYID